MITLALRALIFVVSAALGLIVAALILPGFFLHGNDWWGVVMAVVVFAVLQSILAPWLFKLTRRHAPAFLGGIGLVSTFVALVIAAVVPHAAIGIDGPAAWIVGTLIVWLVTAIATWLLPGLFIKKQVQQRRVD